MSRIKHRNILHAYNVLVNEHFDTTIQYSPRIDPADKSIYQDFELNNIKYRIQVYIFNDEIIEYPNLALIGFYNINRQSENITRDAKSPIKVFGILQFILKIIG